MPDQTISWYRKSRAIYNEQLAKYTAKGHRYPRGAADQATRNEAIRLIAERPIKHALVMVPLIWRGALLTFPLLLVTLIFAWKRDRPDLMGDDVSVGADVARGSALDKEAVTLAVFSRRARSTSNSCHCTHL